MWPTRAASSAKEDVIRCGACSIWPTRAASSAKEDVIRCGACSIWPTGASSSAKEDVIRLELALCGRQGHRRPQRKM